MENSASSHVKGAGAINSLFNPTPRRDDLPDTLGVVDNTLSPEGSSFQAVHELGSSMGLGNTRGLSTAGHFGDHKRISTQSSSPQSRYKRIPTQNAKFSLFLRTVIRGFPSDASNKNLPQFPKLNEDQKIA